MGKDGLTQGSIRQADMIAAREKMLAVVQRFHEVKVGINDTRQTLCEEWVGQGRNEFEVQYKLLIGKVADIGDNLDELYTALVEAEAAYMDVDEKYHQQVTMAMQGS